ncbi:hypothetical protein [Dyadobacter frigoris]|uniref:Uncharacterized protein n=1 Tax=Dyadobacter frigoris TaxID=2576211 RepID=A0A4U6DAU4_9BACT|nr:hypothetical protein [Dyadobacter frigoris]TKT93845.1 hypothetical protein FDK13_01130 [Dyadobacter frigoris]GLU50938.1 hypothetical protein Dfri01_03990 [Dyadobacter frigoris]
MKHLVLVFLLVLFSWFDTFGQESKAREIVKLALKKHTSGKVLKQFEFVMTYEKPGKTNSGILQQDRFLAFMDSLTLTMPDSMKKEMEIQKLEMKISLSQEIYSLYAGQERRYYVDLPSQTIAQIGISSNPRKGRPDSTRTVYNFKKESLLNEALISNPLALLQFIDNDTIELNYTGIINIENIDYHVIQAKLGKKMGGCLF